MLQIVCVGSTLHNVRCTPLHVGTFLRYANIYSRTLNSSNTDDSFTMANSNSFLSPYEIIPITEKNIYLGKFSYFIMKLYVECTH